MAASAMIDASPERAGLLIDILRKIIKWVFILQRKMSEVVYITLSNRSLSPEVCTQLFRLHKKKVVVLEYDILLAY